MKLEYYNPIDEHGGCVIRAISKSLDKDYYIVKEELKDMIIYINGYNKRRIL